MVHYCAVYRRRNLIGSDLDDWTATILLFIAAATGRCMHGQITPRLEGFAEIESRGLVAGLARCEAGGAMP
jgi:hypothetical protein